MSPSAWIAFAGLALAGLAQFAGLLIWGARTSEKVRFLEAKAKEHGDIRDLVIRLDTRMENFEKAITDLTRAIQPRRRGGAE
jgi:hypothetical protein